MDTDLQTAVYHRCIISEVEFTEHVLEFFDSVLDDLHSRVSAFCVHYTSVFITVHILLKHNMVLCHIKFRGHECRPLPVHMDPRFFEARPAHCIHE